MEVTRLHLTRCIFLLGLVLCLATLPSCGKNADGAPDASSANESPPQSTTAPPPQSAQPASSTSNLASGAVLFDSRVPRTVQASVTRVSTFVDEAQIGTTVAFPSLPGQSDTIALALGKDDSIYLASVEVSNNGDIYLSPASTGIALVRIAMGPIPPDITAQTINEVIASTQRYSALVQRIASALEANSAPVDSPLVLEHIIQVLGETIALLRERLGSGKKARPLSLPSTTITTPLPYSLLGTTGSRSSVHVVGTGAGTIQLVNSLPIYWVAQANGSEVELPPSGIVESLVGSLTPWLGPSKQELPDAGGAAFTLVLKQTPRTRAATISSFLRGVIPLSLELGHIETSECRKAIVSLLLGPDQIDKLTDVDAFKRYLVATLADSTQLALLPWSQLRQSCLSIQSPKVPSFVASIAKFLGRLQPFSIAAEATGSTYTLVQLINNWSAHREVGICETPGAVYGFNIANCAARFEVDPPELILAPGTKLLPRYRAYTSKNQETALPAVLKFESSSTSNLLVHQTTGVLTGEKAGPPVEVSIEESSIPAKSTFRVEVVDPIISPPTPTVAVGDKISLRLVSPSGKAVAADNSGTTWGSLDGAIAEIDRVASLLGSYPSAITVRGISPGDATILAWNLVSGRIESVSLRVVPASTSVSWSGTFVRKGVEFPGVTGQAASFDSGTFSIYQGPSVGENATVTFRSIFSQAAVWFESQRIEMTDATSSFSISYRDVVIESPFQISTETGVASVFVKGWNELVTLNFQVLSRSSQRISGSYSGSIPFFAKIYAAPDAPFPSSVIVSRAKVFGDWAAVVAPAFPKLAKPSGSDGCVEIGGHLYGYRGGTGYPDPPLYDLTGYPLCQLSNVTALSSGP